MTESSPIQTVECLLELWDRMTEARSKLNVMADEAMLDGGDSDRLQGKVEGVSLCLSYLDESIRQLRQSNPPERTGVGRW